MVTENTEQLLAHVARYRLTTIDAVYSLFYQETSREAARKALYRLCEAGYLARFELRNRSFYQLTRKGCAEVGAPKNAALPFSAQTLVERYAVLAFCAFRTGIRRITPEELGQAFPDLAEAPEIEPTLQHYYVDQAGEVLRLGRLTIDSGAEVRALVAKCRDIVQEAQRGALRKVIEANAFVLTVLTPHETKRTHLLNAFQKHKLSVPVQVETVSEMKHLL